MIDRPPLDFLICDRLDSFACAIRTSGLNRPILSSRQLYNYLQADPALCLLDSFPLAPSS